MKTTDPFPKDAISILEKQVDRLRKEVDDRMNSNHTLWRAGLAGVGAFILLKESLDLTRLVMALPVLGMGLAAHWLNQLLTLCRAGDSMAGCEARINLFAGLVLLDHELVLAQMRQRWILQRTPMMVVAAVAASVIYWVLVWQVQPSASDHAALLFWRLGLVAALIVHLVAAINLRRLILFPWPALTAAEGARARE